MSKPKPKKKYEALLKTPRGLKSLRDLPLAEQFGVGMYCISEILKQHEERITALTTILKSVVEHETRKNVKATKQPKRKAVKS